jgi:hypothetical protein
MLENDIDYGDDARLYGESNEKPENTKSDEPEESRVNGWWSAIPPGQVQTVNSGREQRTEQRAGEQHFRIEEGVKSGVIVVQALSYRKKHESEIRDKHPALRCEIIPSRQGSLHSRSPVKIADDFPERPAGQYGRKSGKGFYDYSKK